MKIIKKSARWMFVFCKLDLFIFFHFDEMTKLYLGYEIAEEYWNVKHSSSLSFVEVKDLPYFQILPITNDSVSTRLSVFQKSVSLMRSDFYMTDQKIYLISFESWLLKSRLVSLFLSYFGGVFLFSMPSRMFTSLFLGNTLKNPCAIGR